AVLACLVAEARPALAIALSAVLVATHALTGMALASAIAALAAAEALGRRASARRLVFLVALPVVALLLAALWPYYPVLGLLRVFARPELRGPLAGVAGGTAAPLSATGPTMPFLPAISTFGPALGGVRALASPPPPGRPFLPLWFALDLALASLRPLPLHQRFLFFAAMPLMLGAAAVLARAWGAGPLGRAAAVVLLGIGA